MVTGRTGRRGAELCTSKPGDFLYIIRGKGKEKFSQYIRIIIKAFDHVLQWLLDVSETLKTDPRAGEGAGLIPL